MTESTIFGSHSVCIRCTVSNDKLRKRTNLAVRSFFKHYEVSTYLHTCGEDSIYACLISENPARNTTAFHGGTKIIIRRRISPQS